MGLGTGHEAAVSRDQVHERGRIGLDVRSGHDLSDGTGLLDERALACTRRGRRSGRLCPAVDDEPGTVTEASSATHHRGSKAPGQSRCRRRTDSVEGRTVGARQLGARQCGRGAMGGEGARQAGRTHQAHDEHGGGAPCSPSAQVPMRWCGGYGQRRDLVHASK